MKDKRSLLWLWTISLLCACGVKGRPLPPEDPQELGIGRPRYQGVDQEINSQRPAKKAKPSRKSSAERPQ